MDVRSISLLYVVFAVSSAHQGANSFFELMRQQCSSWCDVERGGSAPSRLGKQGPQGIPGPRGPPGEVNMTSVEELIERKIEKARIENKALIRDLEAKLMFSDMKVSQLNDSLRNIMEIIPIDFCYMGMKSGKIADSQLSASSSWNNNHRPQRARLDIKADGNGIGSWATRQERIGEWIQVDLGTTQSIAGIVLQGRQAGDQWVITYKVQCDSVEVEEDGADKIFTGSTDVDTKVIAKFPTSINCRVLRIVPQTWHRWISLRFELINGHCFDKI